MRQRPAVVFDPFNRYMSTTFNREKKCKIRMQLRAWSALENKKNRFFFTFSESMKNIDIKNIYSEKYLSNFIEKFAKLIEL